jgi:hypothetical protein
MAELTAVILAYAAYLRAMHPRFFFTVTVVLKTHTPSAK